MTTGLRGFGEIPDISGGDAEASLKKIQNYLFMLNEQLAYVLRNLGVDNLNESSLAEMKTMFTEDIAVQLSDEEKHIAALQLTAAGLRLSLSDAEEQVSTLEQTVNGMTLTVRDKEGQTSLVRLADGALDLKNLVFTVLGSDGGTVINGNNITTGTISAVDINGVHITGCAITGSTFLTLSDLGQVKLSDGAIDFYEPVGNVLCGRLLYDGFGRMYLTSLASVSMKIASANHLSVDAAAGKSLDIATGSAGETVNIGIAGSSVNLNGTVKVNGVPL